MTVAERIAEAVARGTTRRGSIKTAATAAFAAFAAFAAHGRGAPAERCAVRLDEDTACNPPWGRYCDDPGVGGACDGASCGAGCTVDDAYYPQETQSACWCTALEREGRDRYAYWKCCDCECPGIAPACDLDPDNPACQPPAASQQQDCGCRERVSVTFAPVTRPNRRRR